MKTFKLNTQILIICCALIAFGAAALETRIGSDGRKYFIDNDESTWFQAWHECARWDRQLLTIDSAEKQDVINQVLNVINGLLWLGANDEFNPSGNIDRPYFWSATGKQFTYANWEVNNPFDNVGNQHCVAISSVRKVWLNWRCDRKFGFICEEKQLLASSTKNSNNTSDILQKFTNDYDLLTDKIAQLNERLDNIEQVGKYANYFVEKLTNITQTGVEKILNKQELSTKELNHEITKQANDLNDQLKRSVDELNAKLSEKQNFTYPAKNIVLIKNTG